MPGEVPMRVEEHTILGRLPEEVPITITVDGVPVTARAGEPIAAALAAVGIRVLRYTDRQRSPRGIYCGIGQCTDCAMIVDGVPGVRTCIARSQDGMMIQTSRAVEEGHP